ncbi:MAG: hypothetical protein QXV82_09990 [Ignisphaera sp.]
MPEEWLNIARIASGTIIALVIFGTINRIIGTVSGVSPTATISTTLIQDLLPVIIQLLPIMMIMGMFRSLFAGFGVYM